VTLLKLSDHTDRAQRRSRVPTLLGLAIVLGLTAYGAVIGAGVGDRLHGARVLALGRGYWVDPGSLVSFTNWALLGVVLKWTLTIGILAIVRFWEKRPLASIGLRRPSGRDVLASIGGIVAFGVIGAILALALRVASPDPKSTAALFALPLAIRVIMVATAAFCEEVMFRGFLIERVEELTRSTSGAAAVSCVVFAVGHVGSYGFGYFIWEASVATVFAALYVWRRNLPACMIVHLVSDLRVIWG
jgi:membrane protease YdiL (CAAX protease family)